MSGDDIKVIDEWFKWNENYGTYHHTEEKDGEDLYVVSLSDLELFCNYLSENIVDFIGMECTLGDDSVWFTSKKLKRTQLY